MWRSILTFERLQRRKKILWMVNILQCVVKWVRSATAQSSSPRRVFCFMPLNVISVKQAEMRNHVYFKNGKKWYQEQTLCMKCLRVWRPSCRLNFSFSSLHMIQWYDPNDNIQRKIAWVCLPTGLIWLTFWLLFPAISECSINGDVVKADL